MNSTLILGTILVTLALIFYSVGILTEQRKRVINKFVLTFISLGLLFDVSATICMISGSSNSPFTFHGFIGYTALLAMVIEAILAFRFKKNNPEGTPVPKNLHLYSRFAYVLWVLVFITGAILAR